jgi:hypothetical protein
MTGSEPWGSARVETRFRRKSPSKRASLDGSRRHTKKAPLEWRHSGPNRVRESQGCKINPFQPDNTRDEEGFRAVGGQIRTGGVFNLGIGLPLSGLNPSGEAQPLDR